MKARPGTSTKAEVEIIDISNDAGGILSRCVGFPTLRCTLHGREHCRGRQWPCGHALQPRTRHRCDLRRSKSRDVVTASGLAAWPRCLVSLEEVALALAGDTKPYHAVPRRPDHFLEHMQLLPGPSANACGPRRLAITIYNCTKVYGSKWSSTGYHGDNPPLWFER